MTDYDPATLAALSSLTGGGSSLLSGGTPGADLANFQRTVTANDPFQMAAVPVLSAKLNTSTWTPNQAIAGTLGQAALGSILKAIGNYDVGNQLGAVSSVLPQLYKDPSSVAIPDGVDPSAFYALQAGAIGRQSTLNDLITRTLGEKGVSTNPDGTPNTTVLSAMDTAAAEAAALKKPKADYSGASPEVQAALEQAGGDPILARQLVAKNRAAQPTLGTLSQSLTAIKNLEALKGLPQTDNGQSYVPDWLTGTVNDIASYSGGTNSGIYDAAANSAADTALRALTQVGKGSNYTQKQITDSLQDSLLKGPDALNTTILNLQNDILTGAQQKASDLVSGGYTGTQPILDQINGLQPGDFSSLGSAPITKVINGHTYQKVAGGWQLADAS